MQRKTAVGDVAQGQVGPVFDQRPREGHAPFGLFDVGAEYERGFAVQELLVLLVGLQLEPHLGVGHELVGVRLDADELPMLGLGLEEFVDKREVTATQIECELGQENGADERRGGAVHVGLGGDVGCAASHGIFHA